MSGFNVRTITLEDKKFDFFEIELPHAPLLVLRGQKGFIMCGYLNMAVAEKLEDVAAQVKGVKDLDDFLEAEIVEVTPQGQSLGLRTAMKVREALPLLS